MEGFKFGLEVILDKNSLKSIGELFLLMAQIAKEEFNEELGITLMGDKLLVLGKNEKCINYINQLYQTSRCIAKCCG